MGGPSLAAGLTPAADLARDVRSAARDGKAVLLFFTQPDCRWCDRVRKPHFEAMDSDPAYRRKVSVREVDIRSSAPLRAPDGTATTHAAYAQQLRVGVTPTVIVLGAEGKPADAPIIGTRIPDFYQAYLDEAIDKARAARP